MKFFKPTDFITGKMSIGTAEIAADLANKKLDQEGRIVIGSPNTNWDETGNKIETHKALLINIEPIQVCQHPVDKVLYYDEYSHESGGFSFWQCSLCGVILRPTKFERI